MKSYSELILQIDELSKEAERLRKQEFTSVVKEVKKLITQYAISPTDLGFSTSSRSDGRKEKTSSKKGARGAPGKTRKKVAPRFRDESGNTWTGRGKQPKWLAEAISKGATLESFLIQK